MGAILASRAFAIALVLLKTVADIGAHARQHQRETAQGAGARPGNGD